MIRTIVTFVHARRSLAVGLVLFSVLFGVAVPARAQVGRRGVPSPRYYLGFPMMSDGELVNAEKLFLRESRGAIKTLQARWIDSICYYTMTGECYYQMGQLPEAMEQYTAAVELIVANADWMTRANLPANIPRAGPLNGKEVITWGTRRRKTILGKYPSHYMFRQGRLDNTQQYQQGGVVQKPMMIKVDVIEIVRCSALAIRRRMELLGPASKEDPLNGRLVTVLAKRPCIPNHWSECFIDVQLGLAQLATGKSTQGVATLKRSLSAAGQFEHPLTATALLELGRVTMKVNDLKTALGLFEEATFSAAFYGDIEVLQEAFRYATTVHVMTNGAKPYPALTLAEAWAQRNRFRKLGASLLISMADCEIALHQPGNIANAAKYLSDAAGVIGRHDMRGGYVGARLAMAQASVAFAGGKVSLGNESLAAAMQYMTHGSRWLYQIALIDQLYLEGTMTPRTAIEMYDDVLRDPTALDWMSNPMESLSVLLTPHVLAMEHWFEVALHRGETEKAIEIADRVRRHRFYSTLEFGGRLESLRWLFAGPDSALSDRDKIIRRDLLTRFPNYNALVQQSKQLVDSLRAGPIAPEETDAQATQRDILEKLRAVSLSQESVLREMAVGRTPTSLIFPPVLSTEKIQKQLPKGHALLIFLRTKRGYHAFLLNNERYTHWVLNSENLLRRDLMAFLRDLGQYDRNRELSFKDLTDDDWKKSSRKLLTSLLSSSKVDLSKSFKRLVVIPDGMLWYVPFEALQVKLGDETKSLIDLVEVTYAPTAAMAVSAGRGKAVNQRTGVVVGRLYPRDDEAVAKKQAEQLAEVLPEVTTIPTPLLTGSADYRMAMDRLIVFSDLDETGKVPYSWYPIPISPRFRAGSTLADWMTLPWGGPRTVILPGYHTAAESTLKGVNRLTAGDEIFLSICGLCASGADTVLISRWRTGGKTAYDMAREFAQELPHTTPAAAWQRAILLAREATLDPNEEPRVKKSKTEEPPTTNHPFFWASNILIYGEPMKKEEKKPEVKPADKSADKPAENPLEKPTPDSVRPPKIDPDFPLPDDEPKADDTKATGEEPAKEPAEEPAKEPEEPQTDF